MISPDMGLLSQKAPERKLVLFRVMLQIVHDSAFTTKFVIRNPIQRTRKAQTRSLAKKCLCSFFMVYNNIINRQAKKFYYNKYTPESKKCKYYYIYNIINLPFNKKVIKYKMIQKHWNSTRKVYLLHSSNLLLNIFLNLKFTI